VVSKPVGGRRSGTNDGEPTQRAQHIPESAGIPVPRPGAAMSAADSAGLDRLTERETEFLLLYDRPLLIKEIAFRCGVSEATVHKAFESARRKLGTRTTREAARLVAARARGEKTIAHFHTLGRTSESGNLDPSDEDREGLPHSGAPVPVEQQNGSAPARNWGILAVLWGGGEELTQGQRAAAIVLLAFLIVIASGTLVMIGRGLGATVAAIAHGFR
jgi:DNA-binding CsgD family transcriptional regulator